MPPVSRTRMSIPVIDAGEDDGLLFIAMQRIDGTDLAESLRNVGWLAAPYAVALMHRVACALDAAHGQGLFHRDVKPANILVPHRSPQHPFLTDFGVAARSKAGRPATDSIGTVAYLAPERFDGHEGDGAADVYALAAVLYDCLTGSPPFPSARSEAIAAHRAAQRPRVTAIRTDLPAGIDAVVARGLAVDPRERYPSATAFTRAAAQVLGVAVVDDETVDDRGQRPPPRPAVDDGRATETA